MAKDIILGSSSRNWCRGDFVGRAPKKPFIPESWISPSEYAVMVEATMKKPRGIFGSKPSQGEAEEIVQSELRSKKVGVSVSGETPSSLGAILFPAALSKKIDDVRYDLRGMRGTLGAGLALLAGSLAFVGIASVYRTAIKDKKLKLLQQQSLGK